MSQRPTDEHLARQAQRGNQAAFLGLYERYLDRVYRRVRSRVPETYVEDVTQEIFIAMLRALNGYEQRSQFSTWLYTIVNRQIADFYRRFYRRERNDAVNQAYQGSLTTGHSGGSGTLDEHIGLQMALGELPVHYQEVILQRFADGLTFAEIAEQREQKLEAVKSLYRRAIQALRDQIGGIERE